MGGNFSVFTGSFNIFSRILLLMCFLISLAFCAQHGVVLRKTCTTSATFRVTFGQSFKQCLDECQRRQRCEIIMYKHIINECSLKDFISIATLSEDYPLCLFTHVQDWLSEAEHRPCNRGSCGQTETCVVSTDSRNGAGSDSGNVTSNDRRNVSRDDKKEFECKISECPRPKVIVNAKILSNMHAVGFKNGYICNLMYRGEGNPYITCMENGTWTQTNFRCLRIGKAPKSNIFSDLVEVNGHKWSEGTAVKFACRPGYQGLGLTATNVIKTNGQWQPNVVRCCNENITQFVLGRSCFATFDISFAPRFEDMAQYCMTRGGYMRHIYQPLAEWLFAGKGKMYNWLISGAKKDVLLHNLRKCLERNREYDLLANFTDYSYEEMVKEVVSRELGGHWTCDTARQWALNEPNGAEDEKCVAFRNGTKGMLDINCSFEMFAGRTDVGFICNFRLPDI